METDAKLIFYQCNELDCFQIMEAYMKKLLVLDAQDYPANMDEIYRVSVRGIIFKDNKLLLIQNDFGEVKLPGGGVEPGEDDYRALAREVKEETGYDIITESIVTFGEIEEKRLSNHEPLIWHQINRLYFCEVHPNHGECKYTENEKKYGLRQVYYSLDEAIKINEDMLNREGKNAWNQREYKTLLMIKEYLGGRKNF